jgi:hypothetical protein
MSAKATFANLSKKLNQSDVIKRRQVYATCKPNLKLNTLQQNKYNLVAGLYSKMDLDGVCVVSNGSPCTSFGCPDACTTPTSIDVDDNFYFNYTIDPNGVLFGKHICKNL